MRYGDEGVAILEWLITTLSGDDQLAAALDLGVGEPIGNRLWEGVAPEGTPFPVVIFTVGEPQDVGGVGPGPRTMTRALVDVTVVDEAEGYGRIKAPARRLSVLLNGSHNTAVADGGTVLTCLRRSGIQYPEQVNGVQYRHLGATYEVLTQ